MSEQEPIESAVEMANEGAASDAPAWRKRVMRGGRWVQPKGDGEGAAEPSPSDFRYMSVKLRLAEIEEFKETCARVGVTPNRAMRSMVREAAGYLEVDAMAQSELRAIGRQISGVARNVNQIARVANETGRVDREGFAEERKELGRLIAQLDAKLRPILDVSKRRRDGERRLARITDRSNVASDTGGGT